MLNQQINIYSIEEIDIITDYYDSLDEICPYMMGESFYNFSSAYYKRIHVSCSGVWKTRLSGDGNYKITESVAGINRSWRSSLIPF